MAASVFGTLVVIKRNGQDGSRFPLKTTKCVIGRSADSDVRLHLPTVSLQHCRIDVLDDGQIALVNLSQTNHTELNGEPVTTSKTVSHGSLFTVADRTFRWEFPKTSPFFEHVVARSSSKGKPPSSENSTSVGSSDNKNFTSTVDDNCSTSPNSDVENTNSRSKPLKRGKSPKDKNGMGPSPEEHSLSPSLAKQRYSHLLSNEYLSLKKVSFGPNLSPEQFDNGLPSATPIKKGGRPPARRPSMPDYYGNPILTPVISVSRDSSPRNSKTSPKSLSFKENAKSPSVEQNVLRSTPVVKLRNACKIERPVSKSMSPKSNLVRLALKSRSMSAASKMKGKRIGTRLGVDNAVKIVAPSSLDSKKSAALRTIHAGKLKLKKSKSSSSAGRRSTSSLKTLKIQIPFKSKSTDNKSLKSFSTKRNRSTASSSSVSSIWNDTHPNVSPNVPTEMFVSPLCTPGSTARKTPSSAVKRFFRQNKQTKRAMRTKNSMNTSGVSRLLGTYSTCTKPSSDNILNSIVSNKSPIADYTDVTGLRRLFKSPRKSPISNYSDVHGLKRLLRTPTKSPEADYMNVDGVKRLLREPQKSPKSEYTDVFGLKRLLRSRQKSPTSSYSDLRGLKRLLKTPPKSPKSNYLDVDGVAALFRGRQSIPRNAKRESPTSLENASMKTPKISPSTMNAMTPMRVSRSKTPTNATVSPKLSGRSPTSNIPCVGSPSASVTLSSSAKPRPKPRKKDSRNSSSPKITTRTLRSSARKKTTPGTSPKSPLTNTPIRSSRRRIKNDVIIESPLNNRARKSPSKSPATQPLMSNDKSKRNVKLTKHNEISPDSKPAATPRTRKAATKLLKNVGSLPVNSPEDENTPLRKMRSAKKRLETKDLKSSESPVTVGRITRASRRQLVTEKSPLETGSPKLVRKKTANRSPENQSPPRRILRRRAK